MAEVYSILFCHNRERRPDPATGNPAWRYILRGVHTVDPNLNPHFVCPACHAPLRAHLGDGRDAHFEHVRAPRSCALMSATPPVLPPVGTDCGPAPATV